jgi:hypothetical protein
LYINGVLIGALAFLSIGVWHPIVIKGEYYLGKRVCIPIFALVGLACIAGSLFCPQDVISTGLAVFGFSALWGIGEVIHQEKRVEKGWFPKNPRRQK